jgi:protein SCO1
MGLLSSRTLQLGRVGLIMALGGTPLTVASAPSVALAHGDEPHPYVAPLERVELSFGRSDDYDYDPPMPGSYQLPPIKEAGDGWVLDTRGRRLRLHQVMDGHITVFAFIYTRCSDPQGCPLSMTLLYDLLHVGRQDPTIGANLRLVAMSFDPGHDTPEVMADYAGEKQAKDAERSQLVFLTTEARADLKPILEAYDQPIGRKPDAADAFGPYTHQLRVFLIDRQARLRNIYSLGFLDPRLVITDVRTLLLEEHGKALEK